jgi:signal transduction histidine kinase
MTTIATRASEADFRWLRFAGLGLSGRLILLTMSFVMLAQIIVYIPSVASFRRSWVDDRAMGAQMIVLALSSTPPGSRSPELEGKLLAGIKGAQAIGVRGSGTRWLVVGPGDQPPETRRQIDLRNSPWWRPLRGLLRNVLGDVSPATSVIAPGVPGVPGVEWVELVLDETPLWRATVEYTRTFFLVSLAISAITSALLYLALHLIVVRPVQRLSSNITAFASNPEDTGRVLSPSGRQDEIGRAEEALARMETALAGELRQRRRLADLGLAVSKINHELRNMLTTAQILSDGLAGIDDPRIRRVTPRLMRTLDRAIEFCGATLAYGRAPERVPQREPVALRALVAEQTDLTALAPSTAIDFRNEVPDGLVVDADPDQLGRILANLVRNSVEAVSQAQTPDAAIVVSAGREGRHVWVRVADNGPGVPERIRDQLFTAFQASLRAGGTGLGLPVASELVRLHGGELAVEDPTQPGRGASFRFSLPQAA